MFTTVYQSPQIQPIFLDKSKPKKAQKEFYQLRLYLYKAK